MKRKKMKWTPPSPKKEFELFFYTISFTDDGKPIVNQVPERPADVSEDDDSILLIEPAEFALNITWLNGKPCPESDARNRGVIAVMTDIAEISGHPEIMQRFGIGHAYGAEAEIHEK